MTTLKFLGLHIIENSNNNSEGKNIIMQTSQVLCLRAKPCDHTPSRSAVCKLLPEKFLDHIALSIIL